MIVRRNNWLKRSISLVLTLAIILSFSITTVLADNVTKVTFGEEDNQVILEEGTYSVPAYMKNSSNITSDSMAAGCLTKDAKIVIHPNGKVTAYLKMQTLNMNNMDRIFGNATNLYVYNEHSIKGENTVASVESKRIGYVTMNLGSEPKKEVEVPEVFSFTMPYTNHSGVYAKTEVDAMGMSPDVYILFDFAAAKEVTDVAKLQSVIKDAKALDEGKYTSPSYLVLQDAIKSAEKLMEGVPTQREINKHIELLQSAIKQLELNNGKIELDKNNLKDGVYEVNSSLWHATNNTASMANSALKQRAKIVVKNGVATIHLYTQKMTMGTITAYLQELKIYKSEGTYVDIKPLAKDSQGNPTEFAFELPSMDEFIKVKVNPHVAIMGNMDIEARLKFDYTTLKLVESEVPSTPNIPTGSEETIESDTNSGNTDNPATADKGIMMIWLMITVASASAMVILGIYKKKFINQGE